MNDPTTDLKIRAVNLNLKLDKEDLVKFAVTNFRTKFKKAANKYWRLSKQAETKKRKASETARDEVHAQFMGMFQEIVQECEKLFGPLKSAEFYNHAGWNIDSLVWHYKGHTLISRYGNRVTMYARFQRAGNSDSKSSTRVDAVWAKIPADIHERIVVIIDQLQDRKDEASLEFEKVVDSDPWLKHYSKSRNFEKEEEAFKDQVRAKLATFSLSRLTGDEAESLRQLLLGTDPIPDTHPALCDTSHT